jgi:hypothetical protein
MSITRVKIEDLDEVANKWNITRDQKYKDLWYKLTKEYAEERRVINEFKIKRLATNFR